MTKLENLKMKKIAENVFARTLYYMFYLSRLAADAEILEKVMGSQLFFLSLHSVNKKIRR